MSHRSPFFIQPTHSKNRSVATKSKVSRHQNPFSLFTPFSSKITEGQSYSLNDDVRKVPEVRQEVTAELELESESLTPEKNVDQAHLTISANTIENNNQNQRTKQDGSLFMRPIPKPLLTEYGLKDHFKKPMKRPRMNLKIDETSTEATLESRSIEEISHSYITIEDSDCHISNKGNPVIIIDEDDDKDSDEDCCEIIFGEEIPVVMITEDRQRSLLSSADSGLFKDAAAIKNEDVFFGGKSAYEEFRSNSKKNFQVSGVRVPLSNNIFNKNYSYKGRNVRYNF